MHRKLTRTLLAAALAGGLTLPSGAPAHAQSTSPAASGADIGFARAEQIALAQVKGGTVKEMKRADKKGRATYSVEVRSADNREVDVTIDALDGSVIRVKQDD